jgi:hypothetical protein
MCVLPSETVTSAVMGQLQRTVVVSGGTV